MLFFLQLMKEGDTEGDVVDLACSLASLGHGVTVQSGCRRGGENCFKNLFHEFLLIKVRSRCSCHSLGHPLFISAWLTPIQLRHLCIVACGCAVQRQFEKKQYCFTRSGMCASVSGQAVLNNTRTASACASLCTAHRHQIGVQGSGDSCGSDIVVECAFSSHFRIPCATRAYQDLLAHLPDVFVGPLQRMLPLVDLMTRELSHSFSEAGITMPPWRSARSVMSKWAPQKATGPPAERGGLSEVQRRVQAYLQQAATSAERAGAARVGASSAAACAHTHDAGALEQAARDGARDCAQARRIKPPYKQRSGGGSPVLSVKLGFASPQALNSSACTAAAASK